MAVQGKHSKYGKLVTLLEQEARCEVLARLGQFNKEIYCNYYDEKMFVMDKIRKKLFGTSDLTELGHMWNLPIDDSGLKPRKSVKGKRKRKGFNYASTVKKIT